MAVAASARNALKIIRCTANKKLSSAKNHVKTIASTFLSPSITVKHFASVGKLLTSIIQFLIDNNSGDIPSFEGLFYPHTTNSSHIIVKNALKTSLTA
ncbi:hypothetical protein GBS88_005108 [Escherichia coli]|nr:hypothetical protein [Escherichia coli]EER1731845.1 hypothetical protein [Escherichia coli]